MAEEQEVAVVPLRQSSAFTICGAEPYDPPA
jgi:hypothetical protein